MMEKQKENFIIASGPVIIENGKVLLNRHGEDEKARQIWKFVGGRVELDDVVADADTLETACKREVKEEMGLELEIIMPLKPMLIKHPDKPGVYVILIHYLAKRLNDIKPSSEIVDWDWFDINKLPENCAPNIRPVVEDYQRTKPFLKT